jgi:PAS domain S-box-containing protein
MDTKADPTPFDQKLFLVFIVTFATMMAFECAAQFLYPYPPDWRSNLVRSLFVSGLAVIIAYFPLNSYYIKNREVLSELERRRSAETKLRESESYLSSIIRVSPIGIGVISDQIVKTVNDQLCHITGYTAEELIGKSARLLYPAQEDYDYVIRENSAQIAQKGSGKVETRWQKRDGTIIDVLLSSTPVDPSDRSSGITFTALDVTERKRAEEALRKSEEKYRLIVENARDIIYTLNTGGELTYVSPSVIPLLGYSPADLIGHSLLTFIHPDDLPVVRERYRRSITDDYRSQGTRCRVRHASGEWRWLITRGEMVRDSAGNVLYFLGIANDITEQTRVEEQLLGSERRLADIISFLPDATFVIDKNGAVLAWNRAMVEMTGIPAEQMIGKADYEYALPFYHERRPIMVDLVLHYDPAVVAKYQNVKKEGSSLFSEIFIPHLNKGRGAHLWFTASPLYDTAGNLTGAIESIRDITERKRAEDALRESEERYRNVVEDQTEFISRFLPDGTHIFVNEAYCRYFGLKREDIVGHRFRPVLHPEDREIVAQHIASITPEHPVMDIEQRIIMPDGSIRWQRWSDRAIFDDRGKVTEYQSVGRDITERKKTEQALQLALKKLTMLSSITRHDILNQLMAMRTYLEFIKEREKDPELLGFLRSADVSGDTIREQIEFTRYYQNLGVQTPQWQEVAKVFLAATSRLPLGGIAIDVQVSGLEVYADPLIEKVFYNIVENSLRHGGQVTSLVLSAEETPDGVIVIYRDNGAGIAVEDKHQLFQKGFGKHTGLGLFLSREILSITGITITETGRPGTGVRFEIRIPKGEYRFTGIP